MTNPTEATPDPFALQKSIQQHLEVDSARARPEQPQNQRSTSALNAAVTAHYENQEPQ